MRRIWGLVPLMARRAMATPQLLAIRFAGVLVAVILVAGVSLYSAAMGDAMLQQRVQTDPDALTFVVSQTSRPLTPASFAALDSYIHHDMATDLQLPLHDLQVHHTTLTVPVFRLGTHGTALGRRPLATLGLDYYEGLADHIEMIDGTSAVPAQTASGEPLYRLDYTAQSLQLHVGSRLAYSTNGVTAIAPRLVVAGIFVAKDPTSSFWSNRTGETTYRSLVTPQVNSFQVRLAQGRVFRPSYFWLQQVNLGDIHLANASANDDGINRVNGTISTIAPGGDVHHTTELDIKSFLNQSTVYHQSS